MRVRLIGKSAAQKLKKLPAAPSPSGKGPG